MGSSNEYRPIGSYPPSGIDVLVVGTGLAGATAVLECMRKGHNVRVLERNQGLNMAGDLFWIGLSATRFLQHWPEMKEQWESNPLKETHMATFKHDGTQMVEAMRVADCFAKAGYDPKEPPGNFQQRPLVYKMLVTQAEKIGVKIEYGKRVVSYFEEDDKAGVVTDEGERFVADVVIAADGVGSKSQALVGGEVRAKPSGRAMWRASFDIAHLDQNQEVKDFFTLADNGRPMLRSWLGPSTYALTFTLPEKVVWVINHDTTGTESENWNATVPNEEVIEGMNKAPGPAKWAPIFEDLVRCTPPNRTVNFGLLWRNPQPNWHSPGARVVKLGDAAHSFLPASTNGGTQAIEDAVSIASCLELAGKNNIAQAVKTHTRLRFVRTSCAQKLGFSNAEILQDTDWDKVEMNPARASPQMPKWVVSHDPEVYTYENFFKSVQSQKEGVKMEDEDKFPPNYPPGYKYEEWNIDEIMDDLKQGRPVQLGPGDWK